MFFFNRCLLYLAPKIIYYLCVLFDIYMLTIFTAHKWYKSPINRLVFLINKHMILSTFRPYPRQNLVFWPSRETDPLKPFVMGIGVRTYLTADVLYLTRLTLSHHWPFSLGSQKCPTSSHFVPLKNICHLHSLVSLQSKYNFLLNKYHMIRETSKGASICRKSHLPYC